MHKILLICLIYFLIPPVLAGSVGYINYEKVVANYQYAKNTLKEIEMKSQEIEQYLQKKNKNLIV